MQRGRIRRRPWLAAAALSMLTLSVAGCTSLGYYVQAARGQWGMLTSARPIDAWLDDPRTFDPAQNLVLPDLRVRRLPRLLRALRGRPAGGRTGHTGIRRQRQPGPGLLDAGLVLRSIAQHIHQSARARTGTADLPRAGAPGRVRTRRHRLQR